MQLWASPVIRRLSLRVKTSARYLTLCAGRAHPSPTHHTQDGLRCGAVAFKNKQISASDFYKRACQEQIEATGNPAFSRQEGLGSTCSSNTNRGLELKVDGLKPPPSAEKRNKLLGSHMNVHKPVLQKQECESGPESAESSTTANSPKTLPLSMLDAVETTKPAELSSLVAQGRLPSNMETVILSKNTIPGLSLVEQSSPQLEGQKSKTTTKSDSTQRQDGPTKAPTGTKRKGRRREERDAIVPPTAESGGVPEPSSEYLLRASFLPQTLSKPRPMLVVIDLNGTLLYRPNRKVPSRFVARPHARGFLAYCIDTFHVVIWSSAREQNVVSMCENLLTPDQRGRVLAVWGRDNFGLSRADYARRVQCYKRLTRVWAAEGIASAHPLGGVWDQGNTVLIDDSAEKARSEPFNAVQIPEFLGKPEGSAILPQVHDYLNTLACQQDISMYIRVNPFKAEVVAEPGESADQIVPGS